MELKVKLHLMLYEQDGADRFHVHAAVEGKTDLVDVTSDYEVMATVHPQTGQRGFVVMKKPQEGKTHE